jgi:hypothetical protein
VGYAPRRSFVVLDASCGQKVERFAVGQTGDYCITLGNGGEDYSTTEEIDGTGLAPAYRISAVDEVQPGRPPEDEGLSFGNSANRLDKEDSELRAEHECHKGEEHGGEAGDQEQSFHVAFVANSTPRWRGEAAGGPDRLRASLATLKSPGSLPRRHATHGE